MGVYPYQTAFNRVVPVLRDMGTDAPAEYMGAPPAPVQKVAEEILRLPAARTTSMYLKGVHDCTDWFLTDPEDGVEFVSNYQYQRTRFVEWDGVLYDRQNNDKSNGVGAPVPVLSQTNPDLGVHDRVAVTAPADRPVTVVVSWNVFPIVDLNPDGPGAVGSGGSSGAYGQVMWTSVAGPDKGIFGFGPYGFSLIGLAGIGALGWPAFGQATLVVPPSSTYEIALHFVGGIDATYFNGVGRESQVVRTRLLGTIQGLFGGYVNPLFQIPPAYFQGFSTVPEVGPAKLVNESLSMMTVTTY